MKNLVLSMLAIASISVLSSCSSENDVIDNEVDNILKEEVKLSAGVGTITTKAVMENISTSMNVYFFCPKEGSTADWTTGTEYFGVISEEANNPITLYKEKEHTNTATLYYNADATKLTHLAGCYTGDATVTDNLSTDASLSFDIDGTNDIMATNKLSKSKNDKFGTITFEHLLAQLYFVVEPADGIDADVVQNAFGKVKKIEVLSQPKSMKLSFKETTLLTTTETTTPYSNTFTIENTTGVDIKSDAAFGSAMILPQTDLGKVGTPINLKVYTENNTTGYTLTATINDGNVEMKASKKYTITLKFSPNTITVQGALGTWDGTGNDGGSGNIEDK